MSLRYRCMMLFVLTLLPTFILGLAPVTYAQESVRLDVKPGQTRKVRISISSEATRPEEVAYVEITATNSVSSNKKTLSTDGGVGIAIWGNKQCTGTYTAYNALNQVIYRWDTTQSYRALNNVVYVDDYSVYYEYNYGWSFDHRDYSVDGNGTTSAIARSKGYFKYGSISKPWHQHQFNVGSSGHCTVIYSQGTW